MATATRVKETTKVVVEKPEHILLELSQAEVDILVAFLVHGRRYSNTYELYHTLSAVSTRSVKVVGDNGYAPVPVLDVVKH